MNIKANQKAIIFFCLACLGLIIYFVLDFYGILNIIQDDKFLQHYIRSMGALGPIMIILFMTIAILVSPLPSAPIAITAGALYGHTWGTLYVITGSLLGASGAFFIARYLGNEFIQKYAGNYLPQKLVNSQNTLMGIVFVSRLMPFISFDVISYAAGLTTLVFWRFAFATLFGIAPASFFLAHVGSEVATAEINRIGIAILLLTVLAAFSYLIKNINEKSQNKNN